MSVSVFEQGVLNLVVIRSNGSRRRHRGRSKLWKIDPYHRTPQIGIGAVGQLDGSAMFFNNATADPESKAGAQFPFGGEEGLKYFVQVILQDAWTAIGNRHGSAGPAVGSL
jgi:hypothetical protein